MIVLTKRECVRFSTELTFLSLVLLRIGLSSSPYNRQHRKHKTNNKQQTTL